MVQVRREAGPVEQRGEQLGHARGPGPVGGSDRGVDRRRDGAGFAERIHALAAEVQPTGIGGVVDADPIVAERAHDRDVLGAEQRHDLRGPRSLGEAAVDAEVVEVGDAQQAQALAASRVHHILHVLERREVRRDVDVRVGCRPRARHLGVLAQMAAKRARASDQSPAGS